jgi:Fe2+ or Zn2+ uptake regulation protein
MRLEKGVGEVSERLEAGRFVGNGFNVFTVKCLECGDTRDFDWGHSGCMGAPRLLRANGYTMTGRTVSARWTCGDCSRGSPA